MILTFVINFLGVFLILNIFPTEEKNGYNIEVGAMIAYILYLTIKFIWGFVFTCKHLS